MTPNDRKYTKTHEWIMVDGDTATVGISDHAQEALGDITFVDPAAVGKELKQGEECAVIESVKAASEIYAPIDGKVAEINPEIDSTPELVNHDPYAQGWILKLSNINQSQLDALLDAAAYDALTGK
ncbi:MAG: glycine cleavage system protein GcvH [Kiritimatiellae bacterium]|nr:glycine cleavage system protein GcvH [Kiritimatiellia bacterium]